MYRIAAIAFFLGSCIPAFGQESVTTIAEPQGDWGGSSIEWGAAPKADSSCCVPDRCKREPVPFFGDVGLPRGFGSQFGGAGFQFGGAPLGGAGLQFGGAQFGGAGLQFGGAQFGGGFQFGGQFGGAQFGGGGTGQPPGTGATGTGNPVVVIGTTPEGAPILASVAPSAIGASTLVIVDPGTGPVIVGVPSNAIAITTLRGAYKIANNESPKPQDRVYFAYDYYNNVAKVTDIHREIAGFEKTLFDGRMSIGVKLPAFQAGDPFSTGDLGDVSIPLKVLIAENESTGSLLSAGLVVTAPTGPTPNSLALDPVNGVRPIHTTLLQPFVGYVINSGNWFFQGFTSVMAPTDSDDVTALFNDVAIGRWFRGFGPFTSIAPVVELHVNTPLNHRDAADNFVRFSDAVQLTAGTYFELGNHALLGIAAGTPLTGPNLFDVGATVNFNIRF